MNPRFHSWPAPFANPCLSRKPKARVTIKRPNLKPFHSFFNHWMLTTCEHFWAYVAIISNLSKDLVHHQTFDPIDNDQPRIHLR